MITMASPFDVIAPAKPDWQCEYCGTTNPLHGTHGGYKVTNQELCSEKPPAPPVVGCDTCGSAVDHYRGCPDDAPDTEPEEPPTVAEAQGGFLSTHAVEIGEHSWKLRKRGFPMAADHTPPTGQAAYWYEEVMQYVPRSGRDVARQIARLAGEDSQVTVTWRSLVDAVGVADKRGREIAYTQRGVRCLVDAGWLTHHTIGAGCTAKTTFTLQVGGPNRLVPHGVG